MNIHLSLSLKVYKAFCKNLRINYTSFFHLYTKILYYHFSQANYQFDGAFYQFSQANYQFDGTSYLISQTNYQSDGATYQMRIAKVI